MTFSVRLPDGDHGDFSDSEVAELTAWLVPEFMARPPMGADVVLVAQGGAPERLTRSQLVAWLADNALPSSVVRRVERFALPRGFAQFVIVGDEGVRIRGLRVDDLDTDEDVCDLRGASALSVLGSLAGGQS